MDHALIVADDLTGAAEIAAFASLPGQPVTVTWFEAGVERIAGAATMGGAAPCIVVDTESRNLAEDTARDRLAAVLRALRADQANGLVYKKVDSTLRGPIRAEVTLLHDLVGRGPVIAAPAYPRMGRTTRAGVQFAAGVAVADGPAGADPLAPAQDSEVARLLPPGDHVVLPAPGGWEAEQLAATLARHRRDGIHVVVDAECEADLERLAAALRALEPGLVMGTGGLARHLWPPKPLVAPRIGAGAIVVVVGSLHSAARQQTACLEAAYPRCRLTTGRTAAAVNGDAVVLFQTPCDRVAPDVAARDLARAMEEVIALGVPSAVVVTGGESALHVLSRLDATSFDVQGELVDGVPLGRIAGGPWAGTILATKAGGFGGPDVLLRAIERLRCHTP
jgi:D-threonate/D-erythronate kinase